MYGLFFYHLGIWDRFASVRGIGPNLCDSDGSTGCVCSLMDVLLCRVCPARESSAWEQWRDETLRVDRLQRCTPMHKSTLPCTL